MVLVGGQSQVSEMQSSMVVANMARHEEAVAELYSVIAAKLPAMASFWTALASEERAHSSVLRSLVELERTGSVVFSPEPFHANAVMVSIEFVTHKTRQIAVEGTGRSAALGLALDVERSMIENKFFDMYEAGNPSMRSEFDDLRRHTAEHISRIVFESRKKGGN